MKKCPQCNIVFNADERSRCLYCNALLLMVEQGTAAEHEDSLTHEGFAQDDSIILQVIKDRQEVAHDRKFYIVGSYFCTRTLHFMYCFSRNEMKMGRKFRRWLVQPLNMGSFLIIPWVVWNLIDSLFIRLFYSAYCEKCGWKYKKLVSKGGHDPDECEYNQEYAQIIRDIMIGKILQTEDKFKQAAAEKIHAGKRSAYNELCTSKNFFSGVLDITTVWFSIALILLTVVLVVFPQIGIWLHHAADVSDLQLR